MKTVKLFEEFKICQHLNELFPEGVPISDDPQLVVQGENCYIAEPQTEEDAKLFLATALSDDAPMSVLLTV